MGILAAMTREHKGGCEGSSPTQTLEMQGAGHYPTTCLGEKTIYFGNSIHPKDNVTLVCERHPQKPRGTIYLCKQERKTNMRGLVLPGWPWLRITKTSDLVNVFLLCPPQLQPPTLPRSSLKKRVTSGQLGAAQVHAQ